MCTPNVTGHLDHSIAHLIRFARITPRLKLPPAQADYAEQGNREKWSCPSSAEADCIPGDHPRRRHPSVGSRTPHDACNKATDHQHGNCYQDSRSCSLWDLPSKALVGLRDVVREVCSRSIGHGRSLGRALSNRPCGSCLVSHTAGSATVIKRG